MVRILVAVCLAVIIVATGIGHYWYVALAESLPFPCGYLAREKPSIFFDLEPTSYMRAFIYDLVVEDVVDFVVVKNWRRRNVPGNPVDGKPYLKFVKGAGLGECARPKPSAGTRVFVRVPRSNFDMLRGACVLVLQVEKTDTDLRLNEHPGFWSFDVRRTGRRIARASKANLDKDLRALFPDRTGISQRPDSPVFDDDFGDAVFVRAIESGGYARRAALRVLAMRTQLDNTGLVPEVSVTKTVSPDVVEALIASYGPASGARHNKAPGSRALIPGASPETAERIYAHLIDSLYAPFKATNPYGPWFFGSRWKQQIRDKRPELERRYVENQYVPNFAVAATWQVATALVLRLGPPYVKRFYDEFRTEIVNRTLGNSGPSFQTTILAQSEADVAGIISRIRGSSMSPARHALVWALIAQTSNLPTAFTDDLRSGCRNDPGFLNNQLASKKYLDGESFCRRFFDIDGNRSRRPN